MKNQKWKLNILWLFVYFFTFSITNTPLLFPFVFIEFQCIQKNLNNIFNCSSSPPPSPIRDQMSLISCNIPFTYRTRVLLFCLKFNTSFYPLTYIYPLISYSSPPLNSNFAKIHWRIEAKIENVFSCLTPSRWILPV